jgi:ABC-type Na+ efflux pump permease subunit
MRIVALILAVLIGLTVLVGYFIPALAPIQTVLLNWAIILAASAALVGVLNLILVHTTKITQREKGITYSAILLVFLFATLLFGLVLGPDHPDMRRLVYAVIVPVEASFMAVLAVTLLYASIRLLRRRANLMSILFIATALLMLIASTTLPFGEIGVLNDFLRPWVQHVLSLGGARGILIGVALGTLTTGLRVLFGTERPYGGK